MKGTLGLMDLGGVPHGVSIDGSISTVSKEDNMVLLSSEASSSYPDESELELGLGLGLGAAAVVPKSKTGSRCQYAKILTPKDFPSLGSNSSSSCSSCSATKANNASCGTKRTADSISPPRSSVSQVVGWPPIRTYRMNTLVNQSKSPLPEEFSGATEKCKSKNTITNAGSSKISNFAKEKGLIKASSLFVKVNMDGVTIGRKVDLNAHSSYGNLARTLDNMFLRPSTTVCARSSNAQELGVISETTSSSRLLDGSSEFVLTYEDKEGDWMLVGDVPWEMFISSVKRLRIMRTSDANGLGTSPSFMERNGGRPRTKPI